MRCFLILCFVSVLALSSKGQGITLEVIGNAGDYYQDADGVNLHWTVGEIAIEHYDKDELRLSEGFHQLYLESFVTALWELPELSIHLEVFPNPTSGWLNIRTDNPERFSLKIFNVHGQQLTTAVLEQGQLTMDLSSLPDGLYLLSAFSENQLVKTFKINKTDL